MPADSPFGMFTDAQLKREVERLVAMFESSPPDEQELVKRDVAVLREALLERLRERGEGEVA